MQKGAELASELTHKICGQGGLSIYQLYSSRAGPNFLSCVNLLPPKPLPPGFSKRKRSSMQSLPWKKQVPCILNE
jgi:hypothetical protein